MKLSICGSALFILLMFASPEVLACSCRSYSPQEAFADASAVFVGEFNGFVKGRYQSARLKFKVERQWKGDLPAETILPYGDIPGMCGDLHLVKGQKYLIYVGLLKGELFIFVDCGRNRPIKNAAEDLAYLDKQQSK